jgi:hypothetical protein
VAPPFANLWSTGLLPTPNAIWDWAVATFISQNWNTWCQCTGGTGCGQTAVNHTNVISIYGTAPTVIIGPIPDTPSSFSFPWSWSIDQSGGPWSVQLQLLNASHNPVAGWTLVNGSTATSASGTLNSGSLSGDFPAATQVALTATGQYRPTGTAANSTVVGEITWAGCTSPVLPYTPPPVVTPPPDIPTPPPLPTGCTTDQICGKLTYVEQELDAIARLLARLNLAPHAYVESLTHAGLSGNNSFSLLATTIAFKVIVTTLPNRMGEIISSPNRYFTDCYFTAQGYEGPYQTYTLDFQTQVFQMPPLSIELNYSIPNDVVCTVVELAAAP